MRFSKRFGVALEWYCFSKGTNAPDNPVDDLTLRAVASRSRFFTPCWGIAFTRSVQDPERRSADENYNIILVNKSYQLPP